MTARYVLAWLNTSTWEGFPLHQFGQIRVLGGVTPTTPRYCCENVHVYWACVYEV